MNEILDSKEFLILEQLFKRNIPVLISLIYFVYKRVYSDRFEEDTMSSTRILRLPPLQRIFFFKNFHPYPYRQAGSISSGKNVFLIHETKIIFIFALNNDTEQKAGDYPEV